MSRRPIDVIAASKKPLSHDRIWPVIRALQTFTVFELWGSVTGFNKEPELDKSTIRQYVRSLRKVGIVKITGKGAHNADLFTLIKDQGKEAPRVNRAGQLVTQGTGTENMWRSMRMLHRFSPLELAATASTDAHQVTLGAARDYIKFLNAAGYLRIVVPATNGKKGTRATYALIPAMNTGPKPPKIQRIKVVFDPNLNRVMPPKERSQRGAAQ